MDLKDKIEELSFVKSVLRPLLKLKITSIEELLYYLPYRYEDISRITPINQIEAGNSHTIKGKILNITEQRIFQRNLVLTKALIDDESGQTTATWFNQPYLKNTLKINNEFIFSGKVGQGKDGLYFQNPLYEKIDNELLPKFLAIYPLTYGITSRWLRFLIKSALKHDLMIEEFLPNQILEKVNLLPIETSLKIIHSPLSLALVNQAKKRIIFENLLLYQLKIKLEKAKLQQFKGFPINVDPDLIEKFTSKLDFELTKAQKKVIADIVTDLNRGLPMNRLLNGDVGSGKTVVAALISFIAISSGYQVVLMAPTEILARQHFETFVKLLKKFRIPIGLVTSSGGKVCGSNSSTKAEFLKEIADGQIKMVIGTHSLIQKSVKFSKLALIIIDEQHRFGVAQRAELKNKAPQNTLPHFLSLTATPIPRTLSLTIYGDLDISILDELPVGRQKIITKIITNKDRPTIYDFISKTVKNNQQVFVICPRIEIKNDPEKEGLDLTKAEIKAVETEHENLTKIFKNLRIAKLHGKLKTNQKEKIMADFKNHLYDILVATSLIEVGIDIPNATIIMIEGSERFGLAQLHQLRGRVGRNKYQSYCFLCTSSDKKNSTRLNAIIKAKNGFELAEEDLKIRGAGDFLGTRQSGESEDILLTNSLLDLELVESAHKEAELLLKTDPEIKNHPKILERLNRKKFLIHYE